MKRWLSLLLALVLALTLAACAGRNAPPDPAPQPEQNEQTQPLPAPEETPADSEQQTPPQTAPPAGELQPLPEENELPILPVDEPDGPDEPEQLAEDGVYTTKEDVALYIHLYGHLPSNFITKREAEALGWPGGSLEPYAPGMCIGGGRFGNYEGNLPAKKGRSYTECDIDTLGARSRGPKRIVFSNDGLIYYTGDHYETFELLYGEP
ncbi:MAG: ribonuclease [Oscillospiraceae bacterium]|nr:ribonuclease [Oscillospiraceae bacterium]